MAFYVKKKKKKIRLNLLCEPFIPSEEEVRRHLRIVPSARARFCNTVPHASSRGNHRLQIFLTTRDDRSFTTETAKHSLELDPNVVIDGIHISERGCNARLQSHDTDDQLKAVVETDVSLHSSDDRPRANVYGFQRAGCCSLVL